MQEKEIIIEKVKVSYIERIKDSDGTVFVFLHGWAGNKTNFANIYNYFENINILAFDFPGFGHSSKLDTPWTIKDYAKFTELFLNKKLQDKQIFFVGHSFGGRVMMQMLADATHIIKVAKKLVFIGTPFLREELSFKTRLIANSAKILNKITLLPFVSKIKKPLRRVLYNAIGSTDYLELGEDKIMRETFQNTINYDISKYLEYIDADKTVLIWGENDKTVPMHIARRVAEKTGAKLITVPNAGHMPFVENKDEFLEAFENLIK